MSLSVRCKCICNFYLGATFFHFTITNNFLIMSSVNDTCNVIFDKPTVNITTVHLIKNVTIMIDKDRNNLGMGEGKIG